MKNSLTKKLIKIDQAIYVIASISLFCAGIFMITAEAEMSTSKNIEMGMQILGVFVLFIGIAMGVLTFMKIKSPTQNY